MKNQPMEPNLNDLPTNISNNLITNTIQTPATPTTPNPNPNQNSNNLINNNINNINNNNSNSNNNTSTNSNINNNNNNNNNTESNSQISNLQISHSLQTQPQQYIQPQQYYLPPHSGFGLSFQIPTSNIQHQHSHHSHPQQHQPQQQHHYFAVPKSLGRSSGSVHQYQNIHQHPPSFTYSHQQQQLHHQQPKLAHTSNLVMNDIDTMSSLPIQSGNSNSSAGNAGASTSGGGSTSSFSLSSSYNHLNISQNMNIQQIVNANSYGFDDPPPSNLSQSYENFFNNLFNESKADNSNNSNNGPNPNNRSLNNIDTIVPSTTTTTTTTTTSSNPFSLTPSSDISSPSPPSNSHHSSPLQQYSPLPSPSHSSVPHHLYAQHHSSPLSPHASSSPSSDSHYLNTPSTPSHSKKLKREFEQLVPKDEWETYYPSTSKLYSLFDTKTELTGKFGFKVKRTDKNIQFSELDSAWILYRQNRFQVDCDLNGCLESWSNTDRTNPLFVQDESNNLSEVTGLYFTLYVLKFSSSQATQNSNDASDRVSIHQLGNASGKKDGRLPVEPIPVIKGKANWTKLQFGSATANNARLHPDQPNPNQQFFRIVVTLNAVIDSSLHTPNPSFPLPSFSSPPSPQSQFYPLQSKISPPMIVRGQNPGRFLNHDKSCKRDSSSSPNNNNNNNNNNGNNNGGGYNKSPSTPSSSNSHQSSSSSHHTQHSNVFQEIPHMNVNSQTIAAALAQQQQQATLSTHINTLQVGNDNSTNSIRSSSSSLMSTSSSGSEQANTSTTNLFNWSPQKFQTTNPFLTSTTSTASTSQPQQLSLASTSTDAPSQTFQTDVNNFMKQQQQQQQLLPPAITISHASVQNNTFQVTNPTNTNQPQQFVAMEEPFTLKSEPWSKHPNSDDIIYTTSKVGINTPNPTQALSVNGNILVTGDLFKPSDRRIKTNIKRDMSNHWAKIDKLKLYDYDRKKMVGYDAPFGGDDSSKDNTIRETGFLAQELKEVLPNAVTVAGEVKLQDGTVIPNLLVVNDRILLLENIGATQQIGRTLKKEQDHIIEMDKEINRVKIDGKREQHVVLTKMQDLVSFMLSEEGKNSRHDDSCVYCSLMGLGPAWTMFVFGFFFPLFWLFGSFFLFSPSRVKWMSGLVNFITTIFYVITAVLITLYHPKLSAVILIPTFTGMGIVCCILVGFFRQRTWESKNRYYRERMKLIQRNGYQNLNDHVHQVRGNSYSNRTSTNIDLTPISEISTSSMASEDEIDAANFQRYSDIDSFREISINNHKTLQEIPLQKIASDYGKKVPKRFSKPSDFNASSSSSPKTRKQTYTTSTTTTTTTSTEE